MAIVASGTRISPSTKLRTQVSTLVNLEVAPFFKIIKLSDWNMYTHANTRADIEQGCGCCISTGITAGVLITYVHFDARQLRAFLHQRLPSDRL